MNDPRLSSRGDPLLLGGATAEPTQANVVQVLHRLLRGRYMLVLVAGAIGAAAGGAAGWYSQKPKFVCQGQVRVQSDLPTIMAPNYQNTLSNYSAYVATQASMVQNPRVINLAMASDAWRALGRPATPDEERAFRRQLKVINSPEALELIVVTFTDESREAAGTAVREVLHAYEDIYAGKDPVSDIRVSTLTERANQLQADIDRHEDQVDLLARDYGSADLSERVRLGMQGVVQLETELGEIRREMSRRGLKPGDEVAAAEPLDRKAPEPEEIAASDPQMRHLLDERLEAFRQVDTMIGRGVGEAMPDMRAARANLDAVQKMITRYAEEWAKGMKAAGTSGRALTLQTTTEEDLVRQYASMRQARDEANEDLKKLSNTYREIGEEQRQLTELRRSKSEITERLNIITLENVVPQKLGGRITILSYGDTPSFPEVDARKKFAAMGFLAGGGIPVAAVLMWGMMRRRFRFSDEARDIAAHVALLGVLPNLPKGGPAAPEDAAAATHCVHQIRTMLQLGGKPQDKVYCMTSAEAGEGKTSLTLALGLSYARSGARTLLIDADMIGRGLTTDLAVRVEHGLGDALRAGQLNGTVMDTPFERVSILPVGLSDERAIPEFTVLAARRLLDDARREFDVVLVDTGPILGSLEAACVTASADGVVMVIGRGQHRPRLERALEQLRSIQARVVGLVFNRAAATDFEQSSSSTSRRSVAASVTVPAIVQHVDAQDRARLEEIGPLAGAVLTTWRRSE
ncbi:MAG: AAA family ATPase [Phycisphaerales bacterium]|nr:AAA family ATPase [Phycisphaerales bacterium]